MDDTTLQSIQADLRRHELTTTQIAVKHRTVPTMVHQIGVRMGIDIRARTREVWDRLQRDRIAEAKAMIEKGATVGDAARAVGVSEMRLRQVANQNGEKLKRRAKPSPKPSIPSKSAVVDAHLRRDDLRCTEIAKIVGCTRQLVEQRAKALGINGYERGRRIDERRKRIKAQAFRALWDDGLSVTEIAERMGCGRGGAAAMLRMSGINSNQTAARSRKRLAGKLRDRLDRGDMPGSRLNAEQVREIKKWLALPYEKRGCTWQKKADEYGITTGMISHINTGRAWANVEVGHETH